MSEYMTWIDLARERALAYGIDSLSDEDADDVLWNHTAFPFETPEKIADQLDEFFRAANEHLRGRDA
jgi:hypothetical protein